MRMKFTVTAANRHRFKLITDVGKSIFQSSTSYKTEDEAREVWAEAERIVRAPVREEADAALALADDFASKLKTTENSLRESLEYGRETASHLRTVESSLLQARAASDELKSTLVGDFVCMKVRADDLQSELTKLRMEREDLEKELARCSEIREGLQEAVMQAGDRRNEDVRMIEALKDKLVEARRERNALANRNLWQRLFGGSG